MKDRAAGGEIASVYAPVRARPDRARAALKSCRRHAGARVESVHYRA